MVRVNEMAINREKINKKRDKIVSLIRWLLIIIVFSLYFFVGKIAILLITKNLYTENKDFLKDINSIQQNIQEKKEIEEEIANWTLAQKILSKKKLDSLNKEEQIMIENIKNKIEEDAVAYGYLCNILEKKGNDVYQTYFIDSCNEEWFKYLITKKIFWIDLNEPWAE